MSKPTILTGLRANNDLHIGNYFGALLPTVDMANTHAGKYKINLFVPDLHSFTTPIDHKSFQNQIKQTIKLFVAAGIPFNNPDIFIYRQSQIPAHSELTWILDCFTGFGQLKRMTQFKEKSGITARNFVDEIVRIKNELQISNEELVGMIEDPLKREVIKKDFTEDQLEHVSVGLFNYPVLMAADILLYNAEYVPVGDDQTQHLEFTRDIAERINSQFGDIFTLPKQVKKQHEFFGKDQGLRIKSLQDPTKKMSKSDESDKGVIFLTDSPSLGAKKIMSAATDDLANIKYDPIHQPGISNLLEILALLRVKPVDEVKVAFEGKTSYGEFKKEVADEVSAFLKEFQNSLSKIDEDALDTFVAESEKQANEVANQTLLRVQKAIGLR